MAARSKIKYRKRSPIGAIILLFLGSVAIRLLVGADVVLAENNISETAAQHNTTAKQPSG